MLQFVLLTVEVRLRRVYVRPAAFANQPTIPFDATQPKLLPIVAVSLEGIRRFSQRDQFRKQPHVPDNTHGSVAYGVGRQTRQTFE